MTDIDMSAIAALVKEAGYVAYVEQTGGGVATIYASTTADENGYPARHVVGPYNDDVVDIAAGPGWFEGPGFTNPRAARGDFYVGPDGEDPDPDEGYEATDSDTEATLAQRIIDALAALAVKPARSTGYQRAYEHYWATATAGRGAEKAAHAYAVLHEGDYLSDTKVMTGSQADTADREKRMYDACAQCGHSAQWHIWGPRCRKTADCQCTQFVPTGHDVRKERNPS